MSRPDLVRRAAAGGAAAAGVLVAVGAASPWLTLYGGLHPLRGTMGLWGQALFTAGIVSAGGAWMLMRAPRRGGQVLAAAGLVMLAFACWLAFSRIPVTLAELRENPLLVAGAGSGIYLVIAGCIALTVSAGLGALAPADGGRNPSMNALSSARIRG